MRFMVSHHFHIALQHYIHHGNSPRIWTFWTFTFTASKERKQLTTKKPNLQCLFVIALDYPQYMSHSFLVYFGPISVHFSSNQERCPLLSCSQYFGRFPGCHSNCHVTSGIRLHPENPQIQEATPQLRAVSSSDQTKNCWGDWGGNKAETKGAGQEHNYHWQELRTVHLRQQSREQVDEEGREETKSGASSSSARYNDSTGSRNVCRGQRNSECRLQWPRHGHRGDSGDRTQKPWVKWVERLDKRAIKTDSCLDFSNLVLVNESSLILKHFPFCRWYQQVYCILSNSYF